MSWLTPDAETESRRFRHQNRAISKSQACPISRFPQHTIMKPFRLGTLGNGKRVPVFAPIFNGRCLLSENSGFGLNVARETKSCPPLSTILNRHYEFDDADIGRDLIPTRPELEVEYRWKRGPAPFCLTVC